MSDQEGTSADTAQMAAKLAAMEEHVRILEKKLEDTHLNATTTKVKLEANKPPRFKGKDDLDVRDWVDIMDQYCALTIDAETGTDADRFKVFLNYLEGQPRALVTAHVQALKVSDPGREPNLDFLKGVLLNNYGAIDPVANAWVKLESLKQGALSVEEYAREFIHLCAQLKTEAPNEAGRIQLFKQGLNWDMKLRCATKPDGTRWDNFQDMVRFCNLNYAALQQTRAERKAAQKAEHTEGDDDNQARKRGRFQKKASGGDSNFQAGSSGKPPAGKGKNPNHAKGEPRRHNKKPHRNIGKANGLGLDIAPAELKRLMDEGRCLYCKKKGHFARDCEAKKAGKEPTPLNTQEN